jgi:hypothetical protein
MKLSYRLLTYYIVLVLNIGTGLPLLAGHSCSKRLKQDLHLSALKTLSRRAKKSKNKKRCYRSKPLSAREQAKRARKKARCQAFLIRKYKKRACIAGKRAQQTTAASVQAKKAEQLALKELDKRRKLGLATEDIEKELDTARQIATETENAQRLAHEAEQIACLETKRHELQRQLAHAQAFIADIIDDTQKTIASDKEANLALQEQLSDMQQQSYALDEQYNALQGRTNDYPQLQQEIQNAQEILRNFQTHYIEKQKNQTTNQQPNNEIQQQFEVTLRAQEKAKRALEQAQNAHAEDTFTFNRQLADAKEALEKYQDASKSLEESLVNGQDAAIVEHIKTEVAQEKLELATLNKMLDDLQLQALTHQSEELQERPVNQEHETALGQAIKDFLKDQQQEPSPVLVPVLPTNEKITRLQKQPEITDTTPMCPLVNYTLPTVSDVETSNEKKPKQQELAHTTAHRGTAPTNSTFSAIRPLEFTLPKGIAAIAGSDELNNYLIKRTKKQLEKIALQINSALDSRQAQRELIDPTATKAQLAAARFEDIAPLAKNLRDKETSLAIVTGLLLKDVVSYNVNDDNKDWQETQNQVALILEKHDNRAETAERNEHPQQQAIEAPVQPDTTQAPQPGIMKKTYNWLTGFFPF